MQSYQLFIEIEKDIKIKIGKLGIFEFQKGNYIYTGSAKRNIDARIKLHLSKDKNLHWHIDYLLKNQEVKIIDVKRSDITECELNQAVNGEIIVKGFGSSDCKASCGSHLKL